MKPVHIDIHAMEGDTNIYTIQYLTDEGKPIDLTDMTIRMSAKRISDDKPTLDFDIQKAIPEIGMFTAELSPDQTTGKVSAQSNKFIYDCQASYEGTVQTFLAGSLTIDPQVTL